MDWDPGESGGNGCATLPPGVGRAPGYLSPDQQHRLYARIKQIVEMAPYYVPSMPGSGRPFSVMMTNCGPLGWVSDSAGYRYQAAHPLTGKAWPAMPELLGEIWRDVGAASGPPEACLVNLYRGRTRLGSHVDRDEFAPDAAIVSISLGDDALFHIGGQRRADLKQRILLHSGDVLVMGGPARFLYHGVDRVIAGSSALIEGGGRINLTLRRVTPLC